MGAAPEVVSAVNVSVDNIQKLTDSLSVPAHQLFLETKGLCKVAEPSE